MISHHASRLSYEFDDVETAMIMAVHLSQTYNLKSRDIEAVGGWHRTRTRIAAWAYEIEHAMYGTPLQFESEWDTAVIPEVVHELIRTRLWFDTPTRDEAVAVLHRVHNRLEA